MSATLESVTVHVLADPEGDASYLDQDEFADRRAEYQRGDFDFVGVRLVATITLPIGTNYNVIERISSPGLWSIESDSGEDYFRSVAEDEAETLRAMLRELHVSGDFDPKTIPLEYR